MLPHGAGVRERRLSSTSGCPQMTQAGPGGYMMSQFVGQIQRFSRGVQRLRWTCWFNNYISQCQNCPVCPGYDPFDD